MIGYTLALDQFSEKEKVAYWSSASDQKDYRTGAVHAALRTREEKELRLLLLKADNAAKRMSSIMTQHQKTVLLCHGDAQLDASWGEMLDSTVSWKDSHFLCTCHRHHFFEKECVSNAGAQMFIRKHSYGTPQHRAICLNHCSNDSSHGWRGGSQA